MAKKKKIVADLTRNRKKGTEKKTNPFEVKFNKQKQNVLGRKISKHDKGMPGVSRSKGIKKREETLLQEYNQRFKSNKYVDKRFGENDTTLTVEDKMMKRFAMERVREKTNKFSLNDADEELTHYGQSLSEIEKFEEPDVSDDNDDEDEGRISGSLVAREHFGGFLEDSNFEQLGGQKQTWKERMEEVIAKSKKEKYERQMEKEKTREQTDKLDAEFQDVMALISSGKMRKGAGKDDSAGSDKVDDFDIAVRELKYEIKGKATDRLKTEEEIAKEEKERLDKLEKERQRRMKGIVEEEENKKRVHFSADDLNDGFDLDKTVKVKSKVHVCYKDGKMLNPNDDNEDDEEDDGDEDDDGAEEEGSDDNEDEKDDSDEADEDDGSSGEDEELEQEEDDEDNDSDADSYKDINTDDDESDEEKEGDIKTGVQKKEKFLHDLQKKKDVMEAARKELPYTYKAPENYEELLELFHGHTDDDQLTIVSRIRKCYHASLAEGNKEKLQTFFTYLVQYYTDLALQHPPKLQLLERLLPHLYELSQGSPVPSAQSLVDQIVERQEEFSQICERKAGRGLFPALDTLMLLKLVSILFPTSDFRHAVSTPAFLFMTQMLSQCPVKHERDIGVGLFLCNLCLEYVSLSKRYVPESINFLHGLLFLASKKDSSKIEPVIPPFSPVGKHINLLQVTDKCLDCEIRQLKMSEVLITDMDRDALSTNNFRLCAINSVVTLLLEFSHLYKDYHSYKEIFTPVSVMLKKLPSQLYPKPLQEKIQRLREDIELHLSKPRKPLTMKQNKPKPMKMFEPRVEEVFDDKKKKKKSESKEINEKQKLQHKYRKELKGAMREIRKDTQFLARQQLKEQKESDMERKRKVNALHQMLAVQEGEFKAMKRAKKS